eukprot:7034176-Pyramimonas_sp.AAC.1
MRPPPPPMTLARSLAIPRPPSLGRRCDSGDEAQEKEEEEEKDNNTVRRRRRRWRRRARICLLGRSANGRRGFT